MTVKPLIMAFSGRKVTHELMSLIFKIQSNGIYLFILKPLDLSLLISQRSPVQPGVQWQIALLLLFR